MRMAELIQDFPYVGFETLAVEVSGYIYMLQCIKISQDRESMLRLMRLVDRATGCIFVPQAEPSSSEGVPSTQRPNIYSLFTSAAGSIPGGAGSVRDIQERWLDAKDEWDAHELERQSGARIVERQE